MSLADPWRAGDWRGARLGAFLRVGRDHRFALHGGRIALSDPESDPIDQAERLCGRRLARKAPQPDRARARRGSEDPPLRPKQEATHAEEKEYFVTESNYL